MFGPVHTVEMHCFSVLVLTESTLIRWISFADVLPAFKRLDRALCANDNYTCDSQEICIFNFWRTLNLFGKIMGTIFLSVYWYVELPKRISIAEVKEFRISTLWVYAHVLFFLEENGTAVSIEISCKFSLPIPKINHAIQQGNVLISFPQRKYNTTEDF